MYGKRLVVTINPSRINVDELAPSRGMSSAELERPLSLNHLTVDAGRPPEVIHWKHWNIKLRPAITLTFDVVGLVIVTLVIGTEEH